MPEEALMKQTKTGEKSQETERSHDRAASSLERLVAKLSQ